MDKKELILPEKGLGKSLNMADVMYDFFSIKDKTIVVNGYEVKVDRLSYLMDYATQNVLKENYSENVKVDKETGGIITDVEVTQELDKTLLKFIMEAARLRVTKEIGDQSNKSMDRLIESLQKKREQKKADNIIAEVLNDKSPL